MLAVDHASALAFRANSDAAHPCGSERRAEAETPDASRSHPFRGRRPVGSSSLTIMCGDQRPFNALSADGPVTVGRELPSQIRVDDPRISRVHVRIEPVADGWRVVDLGSTNGTFLDGAQISTVTVTDGMQIRLGNPAGIAVSFGFNEPTQWAKPTSAFAAPVSADTVDDDDDEQTTEVTDPSLLRVGAAVAARREELGLPAAPTQRRQDHQPKQPCRLRAGPQLAPRQHARQTGTLLCSGRQARWRASGTAPTPPGDEARDDRHRSVVRRCAGLDARRGRRSWLWMASGPEPRAWPRPPIPPSARRSANCWPNCAELQTTTAAAARAASGPDVALLLSDVRRTYNELMLRAARAPRAALGPRLYAARRAAELSADEAAAAAGVDVRAVADAESGRPVPAEVAATLEALVAQLGQR